NGRVKLLATGVSGSNGSARDKLSHAACFGRRDVHGIVLIFIEIAISLAKLNRLSLILNRPILVGPCRRIGRIEDVNAIVNEVANGEIRGDEEKREKEQGPNWNG